MFLEILRTLEGLAAEFALVRLEGDVNADVGGDVVALDCRGSALTPLTGQVEVVSRLTTNMALADMFLVTVSIRWGCREAGRVDSHRVLQVRRISRRSLPTGTAGSHPPR